jgi:hypothetical protein
MSCHLCAYGSHRVPLRIVSPANPTNDHIGLCERCYAVTCPTHGSRGGGTGSVRFYCADCSGRLAIIGATSAAPPPAPPGHPPGGNAPTPGPGPGRPQADVGGPPGESVPDGDLADFGLDRHPDSVRWAMPALSPVLTVLRELFDPDRLADAAQIVVADVRAYAPLQLGHALGGRLLAAIHEQDPETLSRALGMAVDVRSAADLEGAREIMEDAAVARIGALARELAMTVSEIEPRTPRPAGVTSGGVAIDDMALLRDGLAGVCAAHGYWPDRINSRALTSPLDVPGALQMPAYGLQMLFAYIDGSGLGPYVGTAARSPFYPSGTEAAAAPEPARVYAEYAS